MTARHSAKDAPLLIGYWDIRGLVAPILYALKQMKQPWDMKYYTERQLDDGEWCQKEWLDAKFTLGYDFPNLPYLEDRETGIKLTESDAIMRYVCNKYDPNLLGANLEEKAAADMLNSYVWDCIRCLGTTAYPENCEELMKTNRAKFEAWGCAIAKFLGNRAKHHEATFGVGKNVTYADFICYETFCGVRFLYPNFFEMAGLASLKALMDRVEALPAVTEMLQCFEVRKMTFFSRHASKFTVFVYVKRICNFSAELNLLKAEGKI